MDTVFAVVALIAVAIGLFVAYAANKPDEFRVARTIRIAAPPERVFPLINDLRAMNTWNPFDKKQDPDIKGSYSGPAGGKGAHYDFESKKCGTGYVEVIESTAPRHVVMRLVMTRPMACDNRIDFTVEPRGHDSEVTWAMSGKSSLMSKLMCSLFVNMDKMCGGMFEKGLTDLKTIAEQRKVAA